MHAEDRKILTNLTWVLGLGVITALGIVFAASVIA